MAALMPVSAGGDASPRRAGLRKKCRPQRLGYGRTDIHAENLAPAVDADISSVTAGFPVTLAGFW
jgi:hypothetical protein